MSNKQIRTITRYLHIVVGVLMIVYVYSPTMAANPTYTALVQFVAIPAVAMSGILMWQQARIFKLIRRRA